MEPEISGGTTTIDEAVAEGLEIHAKIKTFLSANPKAPEAALKDLHNRVISEHKDFSSSYPIVVRLMVYENFYVPKVMKNYFVHISNHPWKTREEFLERQAEYLVYVLRYRCPRTETRKIYAYRNEMISKLKKEDGEFIEAFKKLSDQMDKEMGEVKEDRRERLFSALSRGVL